MKSNFLDLVARSAVAVLAGKVRSVAADKAVEPVGLVPVDADKAEVMDAVAAQVLPVDVDLV